MRRNYHFSLLKVCALCFAVQFSLQVPCACKAILIVFDNAGTLCMRTLRKKPTPGVFDYAGSHSAKRNLRDSARSRAFDNAGSHSAKRNLRDSARSRAFDNAGSHSARRNLRDGLRSQDTASAREPDSSSA